MFIGGKRLLDHHLIAVHDEVAKHEFAAWQTKLIAHLLAIRIGYALGDRRIDAVVDVERRLPSAYCIERTKGALAGEPERGAVRGELRVRLKDQTSVDELVVLATVEDDRMSIRIVERTLVH